MGSSTTNTYYDGINSSEMEQGGGGGGGGDVDGLQTLIFMNPTAAAAAAAAAAAYNNSNGGNNNSSSYNSDSTQHMINSNFIFPHAPPPPPLVSQFVPLHQHQHQHQHHHGFFFPNPPHNYNNIMNPPPLIDNNNNNINDQAAREVQRAPHGLSLSLSSRGNDVVKVVSGESPSSVSIGVSGLQSSKYLKAAQELLDELVKFAGNLNNNGAYDNNKTTITTNAADGVEDSAKRVAELTTAERHEIQMKKAKLVNMLDEVEQRYKQYHHHMQIVISWFEQATRIGSAKTYTDLALQTISKQFRCLKDAILGQIQSANKSLGEEDSSGGKVEGSRLKYVDNQIRQQRALQQLGMVQQNAWRPQRGLPERSVSVLRAWLFEHFLHPYPKDSDKIILAKQTGLTRSQVSNWFINARVRLWKPMVEEMYNEEMKGREKNGSDDKANKSEQNEDSTSKSSALEVKIPGTKNQNKRFISKQDIPINQNTTPVISMSTNSTSPTGANNTGFNLIGFSEMESITQGSPKKPRNADTFPSMSMDSKSTNTDNYQMSMNFGNERQSRDGFSLMGAPTNFIGGFGSYDPIGELGRFGTEQFQAPYSGNGVSLTLGLPHCENLSIAGSHQTFQLGRGVEENDFSGMNTPTSTHSTNVYEEINNQNRKRFAAQLLQDFVT